LRPSVRWMFCLPWSLSSKLYALGRSCISANRKSQGRLLEQVNGGVTKDDFTARIQSVLQNLPITAPPAALAPVQASNDNITTPANPSSMNDTPASTETSAPPAQQQVTSTPQVTTSTTPAEPQQSFQQPPDNIQALLAQRGQRLEAERIAREAAENAARAERVKARKQQEAEIAATNASAPPASYGKDRSYEAEQAKRKREAKQDKERILRQIENDKIARKEKEERRRAAARAEQEPLLQETEKQDLPTASAMSSSRNVGTSCALQVRLLDGSTIRSTFSSGAILSTTLRPWIATEQPDFTSAYTFKVIQAPKPSLPISDAEEMKSLLDLGLLPSATLVVVPVKGAISSAYPSSGVVGILGRMYGMVAAFLMWLLQGLQTFARTRQTISSSSTTSTSSTEETTGAASSGTDTVPIRPTTKIRIRTLADRAEKEDRQFYNGNQVSRCKSCFASVQGLTILLVELRAAKG